MDYPPHTQRPRIDCYCDALTVNKRIWHIHGDICKPSGIIMGHYYYEKLVRETEDYIPQLIRRYKCFAGEDQDFQRKSWIDAFLIDDIYMFGFGIDFSESDIWWLLCCKKRNFPKSKVYIYQPEKDLSDAQRIMLQCYNVELMETVKFEGDYPKYYASVLFDIKKRMNGAAQKNEICQ